MLHKDPRVIAPGTFSLIQQLQALPELKEFCLLSGTALALQLGHRDSVDIDFFTQKDLKPQRLGAFLTTKFNVRLDHEDENTLLTSINNVKVDFIKHSYRNINLPLIEEGITF